MVKHVVLAALLVACDSKKPAPVVQAPPQNVTPKSTVLVPSVTAGTTKATEPPPLLVVLDGRGNVRIAAVPTWAAIAKLDPAAATLVKDVSKLEGDLLTAVDHGETAAQTVERIKSGAENNLPVATKDGSGDPANGGTGTAMATEGARLAAAPPDQQEQHADATGLLGDLRLFADTKGPGRRALVAGELRDLMKPSIALLLPDPRVSASRLIDLVAETMGMIGVERDGAVVPLRLQVYRTRDRARATEPSILEVHVRATTLEPDLPALKLAIGKRDAWSPIDLLVDHDVNAERLVDTIVQLDQAGARILGLGFAR